MDEAQEKKQFREARKREAAHKFNRDKFVQAALTTTEGRDYFYWLLGLCKMGQQPFTNNALSTAFQCGELNVGQQVQAHIIEVAPGMFLRMLTEKDEENKNAARRTSTAESSGNGASGAADPYADTDAASADAD